MIRNLTDPVVVGQKAALHVAVYMHSEPKDIEGLFTEDIRTASAVLGINPTPSVIEEMIAGIAKPKEK